MELFNLCTIILADGSECEALLPGWLAQGGGPVPRGFPLSMGRPTVGSSWTLIPAPSDSGQRRLYLVRPTVAAAATDPRMTRLLGEWQKLQQLNAESDHVHIDPVHLAGGPPEEYRVTFRCRGILRINARQEPVFGNEHRALMVLHENFPAEPPMLRWETPIWHPNIQHDEPHGVCINKKEWLGGMGLDDLCRFLFEMVQYKNYHAEAIDPYPLDGEVARWVREVAEPRGFVNKRKRHYVDDQPFTRPTAPSRINFPPPASARVRLLKCHAQPQPTPAQPSRIRFVSNND